MSLIGCPTARRTVEPGLPNTRNCPECVPGLPSLVEVM
jgi:hypothetical protein